MADPDKTSHKRIRHLKKRSAGDIVFDVLLYTFLAVFVIVTLFPILRTLLLSFSDPGDANKGHLIFLPRKWSLINFKEMFKRESFQNGLKVSLGRTILGTVSSLAVNSLLAFILSRRKFLFKSVFSLFWVITIYVQGGMVPVYELYHKLRLTSSFLVYIIPGMVNALYVLVLRTYMKSIPESLEESAWLEGAGYFRIFINIVSPLCKPVYAAIGLFIAVNHWNSWFDAMLYNRMDYKHTTLQYEIVKYLNQVMASPGTISTSRMSVVTLRAALITVTMLPFIVIYPFFQRFFIAGLKVGGIKD